MKDMIAKKHKKRIAGLLLFMIDSIKKENLDDAREAYKNFFASIGLDIEMVETAMEMIVDQAERCPVTEPTPEAEAKMRGSFIAMESFTAGYLIGAGKEGGL